MEALLVVDAQNEFSPAGLRPVRGHEQALERIRGHVSDARREGRPIAWIRHHNRPHESRAFVPGSWGAELSPGLGVALESGPECLFEKDVFGAFAGTDLERWLRDLGVTEVLVVGFYSHMCVSTTTREALVRDFAVSVDPLATGAADIEHPALGRQTAEEVRRSAMLHLSHMGAKIIGMVESTAERAATPAAQPVA